MSGAKPMVVSIVIPVYNIEDLVAPCVESVLAQTYGDLEILLVDDGSTDASGRLVDEFGGRDARVVVLHKPNGGLSEARNYGIDRATGDYILCVDGDDLITPTHVASLVDAVLQTSAEVAVSQFRRVDPMGHPSGFVGHEPARVSVLSREEALERLFYQQDVTTSAWGKLYSRALFNGIRYPVGEIHEDLPVTYRLLARAERVAVVHQASYLYVQRGGSITNQRQADRREAALGFAQEAVDFTVGQMPQLANAARCRLFMEGIYIIGQAESAARAMSLTPRLGEIIVSSRRQVVADRRAPRTQRFFGLVAFGGPRCIRAAFVVLAAASSAKRKVASA